MATCDLAETLAATAIAADCGTIEIKRFPSDVAAFEFGSPHSGPDSLDDEVALQFSDGADDHDDGAAQRAAGVDLFPERDELNIQPVQFIEDFEEVFDRPGDSIGCPYQDHIESAATSIVHHAIQTGAARFRAADPVRVLFDDLIAALPGHLMEVVELSFWMMIKGADPQVEGGALHERRRFAFEEVFFVMYHWMNSSSTSVMFLPWAAVVDLKLL